jgi:hypothetical protein
MNTITRRNSVSLLLGGALVLSLSAGAQQKFPEKSQAYNLSRETSLQGTVVEYQSSSSVGPSGAHVTVRTDSGTVDVHLGNARLLAASHISLVPGDRIRIIGENLMSSEGTQFLARILVKGNQQVTLRSIRGIPFRSTHPVPTAVQPNPAPRGAL